MPKTVLDVTVTDQDGRELFSREKEFTVNDLYFKGGKQVPMAEWDVTATEHFNLGLRPVEPDRSVFIIPIKKETTSVEMRASFKYMYTRIRTFVLREEVRRIDIDQGF